MHHAAASSQSAALHRGGGFKTFAPHEFLNASSSSGSGALFMIEAKEDVTAAMVPVLDGLGIDDQKLADLTKCMLDFRGMVKPTHFTGVAEDWKEIRDEFLNLMSFAQLDGVLDRVPKMAAADIEVLELEHQVASKLVYGLLYSLCDAVPKTILKTVPRNCGWSGWASLHRTYEPRGSAGRFQKLVELLHPSWSSQNFMVDWLTWERDLARYELDYGTPISQDVKCAVVAQCVFRTR